MVAWNVRTLSGEPSQAALERILRKHNIDIACLSECRITHSDMVKINGSSTLIYSGGNKKINGVGIMVSPLLSRTIVSWRAVSDRLVQVRLQHRHGHLSVISVYAPTENSSAADKDKFYNDLADVLHHVHPHDKLIVAGDFNATSGTDRVGMESIIGPFGSGMNGADRNDNSSRLISLCASGSLSIMGSWFRRKNIHRWTWISPDGRTMREIDHFLLKDRRDAINLKVKRGFEPPGNPDHMAVLMVFKINFPFSKRSTRTKKIDSYRLLHDPCTRDAFRVALSNRFAALADLPEDYPPEDLCKAFSKAVHDCAAKAAPPQKRPNKPWLSQASLDLIEQKGIARNSGDKAKHRELQSLFKAQSKDDFENYLNTIADAAEDSNRRHDMKGIYKAIRAISGSRNSNPSGHIYNSHDLPCASFSEVLDTWQEHFDNTLNHPPSLTPWSSPRPPEPSGIIPPPDLPAITAAISKLKLGRSPGPDGVSAEMLVASSDIVSPLLHRIIVSYWNLRQSPQVWKDATIIPVYKNKGSKHTCSNYRPISLLSVVGKLFASLLLEASQQTFLDNRIPEQSGFTPGRSTTDAILTLRILADVFRLYKLPLYIGYIDFKAAFDSVDRSVLWAILASLNLPSPLGELISELHNGTSSCVSVNGKLSSKFVSHSGVRQGCILAPSLFCLVMDIVLKLAIPKITHIAGIPFSHGAYADDVAFIDTSIDSLCGSLSRLQTEASKFGLNISWAKTKIQNISTIDAPDGPILIDNNSVEVVDRFNYLGCMFTSGSGSHEEILRRIALAGSAMDKLANVWKQKRLSAHLKARLFNSLVVPILLYGSETWIILEADTARLNGFYMQCQRRFLDIRWYELISNDIVSTRTGLPSISDVIRKRRLALFGHVARLAPDAPANKALLTAIDIISHNITPEGWRRPRGRPCKTWLDQIPLDLPEQYRMASVPWDVILAQAHDRNEWKGVATAMLSD